MSTLIGDKWLRYWYRKPKGSVRLFCFPYAGGGASIFRSWSENVPPQIEICPVQLPGREDRLAETPFTDIHSLIDALAPDLCSYLDRPYAFFGHSMGALICLELARYLRQTKHGLEPMHLFVSGHRAPQLPDPKPPTHHLPEPAFVEELRRLKGTPEAVLKNEELFHLLLPLLRADFALCETYSYTQDQPLQYPITAFGGLGDLDVSYDALVAWREHTSSVFKLRFFAGGHFFIHQQQRSFLPTLSQDLLLALR